MPETFGFPEGSVYLWTGGAGATSALVAYAESMWSTRVVGWDNFQTLTGTYQDRKTGQRADVYIGTLHTVANSALETLFAAQTAVHMHVKNTGGAGGSAGVLYYSGRIDSIDEQGRDRDLTRYSVALHFNTWSAYG